jgi:hypothetical protein
MRTITSITAVVAIAVLFITFTDINLAADEQRSVVKWGKSVNPQAQAILEKGDELLGNSKYTAARKQYESAREIIQKDGDFPNPALYRIAASYYYEGKSTIAADQLDKLSTEATQYGDLAAQAWALADAAWINGQSGEKFAMDKRVGRLKQLLKSPYLPNGVRSEIITKRLGEDNGLDD